MESLRRFFRRLGKRIGAKGYTLLEVSAVVAVTGMLAAVAMPLVADKIAASKLVAAQQEVQSIKDSLLCFTKDTGVPPFYKDATSGLALPRETATGFEFVLMTTDGINPTLDAAVTDWPALTFGPSASFEGQLIENTPKYPTKGLSAWKGPYIPSLKKDPWGNKYLAAIKWLAEPAGTLKYQKAVFVISAGPNGIIETKFEQPIRIIEASEGMELKFVVGNDDIVSRIQ